MYSMIKSADHSARSLIRMRGEGRFAPRMGCQSLYPACWWARGGRRRGRAGADPGLRVCLFVCLFSCLLVRTGFGGWSGSEFRGKDRTKRFRRARSTFSSIEVGSDSLILDVWVPFCVDFGEGAPVCSRHFRNLLSLAGLRAVGDLVAPFSHRGCEAA